MLNNKERHGSKYILTVLFIIVLYMFATGTAYNVWKVIESGDADITSVTKNLSINSSQSIGTSAGSTRSIVEKTFNTVEAEYNGNVIFKLNLIDIYGGMQKVLGKRMVEDVDSGSKVYKLNNGQLTFISGANDTSAKITSIKALYDYTKSKHMKFIYVQAPYKINKYNSQLPMGVQDYSNDNGDKILKGLSENNIPIIDLRKYAFEEGLLYNNLFYNTDHHWKIETAYWAYGRSMNYLSDNYHYPIDEKMINVNNFKTIKLEKSFLGSLGRRVGKYYGGVDDFEYLLPNFETQYEVKIINDDGSIKYKNEGSFEEALVIKNLVSPDAPISTNRYSVYFGGDYPLIQIRNYKQEKGKLLIIKDSYALPFAAFASLNFSETDIIDLRYFRHQTLYDYLEMNSYDYVMILYNTSFITDNYAFAFK